MILLLLLLILFFILFFNNDNFINSVSKKNVTDINNFNPDFKLIYDSRLRKYINKNIKILLIGSISQKKLNFIQSYFKNSKIYVYNEDTAIYKNITDNIILNYNPFNISTVKNLNDTKVFFDIILTSGQISIDNFKFIAANYINLLNNDGTIIFENIHSINNVDLIINAIPINIKKQIDIIDLRRINAKYDNICIILDKS